MFLAGYVTTIIEDAKIYSTHAKKSTVDADDIKLAIQCRMDQSFTSPPPRDVRWVLEGFEQVFLSFVQIVTRVPSVSVPVPDGGGAAEEPGSSTSDQTLHWASSTS